MIKNIKNIADYIKNIDINKFTISDDESQMKLLTLFKKPVLMHKDAWKRHVHLKPLEICNAKCSFCSEGSNIHKAANVNISKFIDTTKDTLDQLARQDSIRTISITGGEPTLLHNTQFDELVHLCKTFNPVLFTLNTNGTYLLRGMHTLEEFDCINISRHSHLDSENDRIFGIHVLSTVELQHLFNHLPSHMRIQCVINEHMTVQNFRAFCATYSFATNISFRRMIDGSVADVEAYNHILDYVFTSGKYKFVQQMIQDYYVYETWQIIATGKEIQFSYSNMAFLREYEDSGAKVYQEIIIHPDTTVSGSWDKQRKIIKNNEERN